MFIVTSLYQIYLYDRPCNKIEVRVYSQSAARMRKEPKARCIFVSDRIEETHFLIKFYDLINSNNADTDTQAPAKTPSNILIN